MVVICERSELTGECVAGQSRCEFSPQTRGQYLIYTDKSLEAFSDSSCRQACNTEREFNCRSYSYLAETREGTPQCLLSGDTQKSAGSKTALISVRRSG